LLVRPEQVNRPGNSRLPEADDVGFVGTLDNRKQ
jgi:hypothetical protein